MQWSDVVLEPRRESALVLPRIRDDTIIFIDTEVVHLELPFAGEIAMAEWHFSVERARFWNEQFHAGFVMDLRDGESRILEIAIVFGTETGRRPGAAGDNIFVW